MSVNNDIKSAADQNRVEKGDKGETKDARYDILESEREIRAVVVGD